MALGAVPFHSHHNRAIGLYPIGSMYGMFTNIWLIFMLNVGTYASPMDPMGMKKIWANFIRE